MLDYGATEILEVFHVQAERGTADTQHHRRSSIPESIHEKQNCGVLGKGAKGPETGQEEKGKNADPGMCIDTTGLRVGGRKVGR